MRLNALQGPPRAARRLIAGGRRGAGGAVPEERLSGGATGPLFLGFHPSGTSFLPRVIPELRAGLSHTSARTRKSTAASPPSIRPPPGSAPAVALSSSFKVGALAYRLSSDSERPAGLFPESGGANASAAKGF
ncbi:MAG: hypothetical protein BroJett003_24960 [Planctomycetota bacterium]|nr:MAG: hypothetical protein BroJett003_24960 [Planctomycetota bacterium]